MLRIVKSAAAAAVDAIMARVELGPAQPKVEIYSGPMPTEPGLEPDGANVKLLEIPLPQDAFPLATEVANGAQSSLQTQAGASALASGIANWFLVRNGNAAIVMDGNCTLTSGTGACKMQDLQVIAGRMTFIRSLTAFHPQ